jgi:hypothetical protein
VVRPALGSSEQAINADTPGRPSENIAQAEAEVASKPDCVGGRLYLVGQRPCGDGRASMRLRLEVSTVAGEIPWECVLKPGRAVCYDLLARGAREANSVPVSAS